MIYFYLYLSNHDCRTVQVQILNVSLKTSSTFIIPYHQKKNNKLVHYVFYCPTKIEIGFFFLILVKVKIVWDRKLCPSKLG